MHRVLKAFPCSFDGIKTEDLKPGDERNFGSMAEGLKKAGLIGEIDAKSAALREDGPTIAEYVKAGYPATGYPPQGYASRSSAKEIAAAVKAEAAARQAEEEAAAKKKAEEEAKAKAEAEEAMRADLGKMTNAQLIEIAAAEAIAVETDDNKAALVEKIMAGRFAKTA